MANENTPWQLEDFVDSLVVELDKTRDTLAVKAINKPLSYTVKEVALDLNIFPSYDGDKVKFITAQPGQEGASKVTIQLGSITDQQVRATTKLPAVKNDVSLAEIGLDKTTQKKLEKIGVNSLGDLKQVEQKNVDLKKVSDNDIDYTKLANQIQKSRRDQAPPRLREISFSLSDQGAPQLVIQGDNLAVNPKFPPVAVLNNQLAEVLSSDENVMLIQIGPQHTLAEDNELILTFDPYAILKVNLHNRKAER